MEQCGRRYQSNSLYRLLPGIFFTLLLNPSVGVGQQLPPGAGKEPFERICSSCHALNVATQTKRTHAGWEGTVETMRGRGASGTEADFDRIVAVSDRQLWSGKRCCRSSTGEVDTGGYRVDHLRR